MDSRYYAAAPPEHYRLVPSAQHSPYFPSHRALPQPRYHGYPPQTAYYKRPRRAKPHFVKDGTHYYNTAYTTRGVQLQSSLQHHDPIAIRKQVEWYFQQPNVDNDIYLRNQMDKRGYVPVKVIANFNRLKKFRISEMEILHCCASSTKVKVKNGKIKMRDRWYMYVLPGDKVESICLSADEDEPVIYETGNQRPREPIVQKITALRVSTPAESESGGTAETKGDSAQEKEEPKSAEKTAVETNKEEDGKWLSASNFFTMMKEAEVKL